MSLLKTAGIQHPSLGTQSITIDGTTGAVSFPNGPSVGDITAVTAGTGISGGGSSGDVTITNSMATAIDAKGDLVVGTGADAFSKLTVGANDTVLTADSSTATGLKWAAPASGGGMTLIQETVLNNNSSLSFSSISGSYKQLLLVWMGIYVSTAGGGYAQLRFNADSGTNYAFNGQSFDATGGATGNNGGTITNATDANNGTFWPYDVTSSTDYGFQSMGTLLIDNYASTSKHKFYKIEDGRRYVGATKWQSFQACGVYRSTSAITSIDITRLSGSQTYYNATNTSVRLYGIS